MQQATQNDLAAIFMLDWKLFNNQCWTFNTFAKYVNNPKFSFPVIISGNELAGFGLAYAGNPNKCSSIYDIAINPSFQGYGLGTAITKHIISKCKSTGSKKIYLEVGTTNVVAQTLYKKLGFVHDKIVKDYYGYKLHAIHMYLMIP